MPNKLSDKNLAVLGTGKLGGILLRAYLKQGLFSPKRVTATVRHEEKAAKLTKELGVKVTTDNRTAVEDADIVLLGVKPQVVGEVLQEIAPHLAKNTLIISVAASVPTTYIEQRIGEKVAVIRAMPNTCSIVGIGMTGICRGGHASPEHLEIAKTMFDAVGRTVVVDEKNMDAVTGLSASGPRLCLHHSRVTGGSRGESGSATGCVHLARGTDLEGRGQRGTGDRRSSRIIEGFGDDTGRVYDRRDHGTRGR